MNAAEHFQVRHAIEQLSRSAKGRNAMRNVLAWLDHDGLSLDGDNKRAILSLIQLAWRLPGSTRDLIREAIDG